MALPLLQAGLEMALLSDLLVLPLPQTAIEPLVPPAVLAVLILCRLNMTLLVFQADLEVPVLCQPNMVPPDFQAVLVVLASFHLSSEPLGL
jgi:hypothetical protein